MLSLRRDIAWAAVGLSNWGTISSGGDYWARFGEPSPMTHFWSLAIEQQIYLGGAHERAVRSRRSDRHLHERVEQWASVPQRVRDETIDVVLVDIGPWDALDMHLADSQVVSVAEEVGCKLVVAAYEEFTARVDEAGATIVWVTPNDSHLASRNCHV